MSWSLQLISASLLDSVEHTWRACVYYEKCVCLSVFLTGIISEGGDRLKQCGNIIPQFLNKTLRRNNVASRACDLFLFQEWKIVKVHWRIYGRLYKFIYTKWLESLPPLKGLEELLNITVQSKLMVQKIAYLVPLTSPEPTEVYALSSTKKRAEVRLRPPVVVCASTAAFMQNVFWCWHFIFGWHRITVSSWSVGAATDPHKHNCVGPCTLWSVDPSPHPLLFILVSLWQFPFPSLPTDAHSEDRQDRHLPGG